MGTADLYADESNFSDLQNMPAPTIIDASTKVVSGVALLFHTVSFATVVIVSIVWRRYENVHDYSEIQLDTDRNEESISLLHNGGIVRTRDILMRQLWQPSLVALAASLAGTSLLTGAAAPSQPAATALMLLLGANGMLFALANWVPYTLIAAEAAQARLAASDAADDTPMLLAVHNMAITVPQIAASAASWLLMRGLAMMGFELDVVWIFVMCIPSALWAAFL